MQNRVCKSCKLRSKLRRVWWVGAYKAPLKDLIWGVKYSRDRETARLLGSYLADALPYLDESTVVTHLPTASKRVRLRGYDQAQLMAESFAKRRGLEYSKLLIREDQKELIGKRRHERMKAMQNSFRLSTRAEIKGRTVLLIDDVLTTGASLESAAQVLRTNGADHVDSAVITRHLLN